MAKINEIKAKLDEIRKQEEELRRQQAEEELRRQQAEEERKRQQAEEELKIKCKKTLDCMVGQRLFMILYDDSGSLANFRGRI